MEQAGGDRSVERFGHHRNNFGFLRLLFASLVIVSHTPEMHDGDRSRELLTTVFGTISFGDLAVDAFFIISGYLIIGSWQSSRTALSYLQKRVARIFPAFIGAFVLSTLIAAPLGGAHLASLGVAGWTKLFIDMLLLKPPTVPDAFIGQPYPFVNGAAWTISIEFGCYLCVMLIGAVGILARPWLYVGLTAVVLMLLVLSSAHIADPVSGVIYRLPAAVAYVATPAEHLTRLAAAFLCGGLYRLFDNRIVLSGRVAGIVAAVTLAAMFWNTTAEAAVCLLGSYVLMWAARAFDSPALQRVNNENDVSYGIYLYGWPIGMVIMWYAPTAPLLLVGAATWGLACCFGWFSWRLIEKPAMEALAARRAEKGRPN